MTEAWKPLPLDKPLYANLDEDAVVGFQTAIENGYINGLGQHSRFPGLTERVDLGGKGRTDLHDFGGDLVAVNKGHLWRIDHGYNETDVTGVPIEGGRRTIFAKTDRDLLMAAGGPIVRLRAATTEILSNDAPLATHIAWLDNFTLAVEIDSGRFFHSGAGTPDQWDPLDTFSADGNPDNINSLLVTPQRELLLGGENSVEQFDRLDSGDVPFGRRWAIGAGGVKLPYALLYADNGVWTINSQADLVQMVSGLGQPMSDMVGRLLASIDDWSDAWMGGYPDKPLHILGQRFIILQAPNATNAYGTKGVTLGYDYRAKRFFSLYGWDTAGARPARWPGWSHWTLWDKVFVGGEGKVYELDPTTHRNGDQLQRWLVRTAHTAMGAGANVSGFRLQVKRGMGTPTVASSIRVRCSRDSRPFGSWIVRSLGLAGQRFRMIEFGSFGNASTFQFEISATDDCPIELIAAEVKTSPLGH